MQTKIYPSVISREQSEKIKNMLEGAKNKTCLSAPIERRGGVVTVPIKGYGGRRK